MSIQSQKKTITDDFFYCNLEFYPVISKVLDIILWVIILSALPRTYFITLPKSTGKSNMWPAHWFMVQYKSDFNNCIVLIHIVMKCHFYICQSHQKWFLDFDEISTTLLGVVYLVKETLHFSNIIFGFYNPT